MKYTKVITTRIRVNVTARDIANGMPMNARSCPIARATLRTNRGRAAGEHGVAAGAGGNLWVGLELFTMPPAAREFVSRFDHGDDVEPFRFIATATRHEYLA